ncbi:hypothetical protein M9H77_03747 [Catharanthus roseus]|uniref:Uncharacterized protein n=1 Tax=Catharanthus roseus TaxID=4058 RepID=A0ACC0CC46_CATRO|nr:hypothetical protein M9H77_03747 [Catharanthus roseus]
MSSSVMFEPSCYGLSNLDGASLVELNMLGFALEFEGNSLQHVCPITSTRRRRHTKEFEGEGEYEFNTFNCASFWRILDEPFQKKGGWYNPGLQGLVEQLQGLVPRAMDKRMEGSTEEK